MPAFTSLLAVASLGLGVAGAAASKKANANSLAQQDKQFKQNRTAAREAGKVKSTADTIGAQIKLGTNDYGLRRDDPKEARQKQKRTSTGSNAGGLTVPGAAQIGGL